MSYRKERSGATQWSIVAATIVAISFYSWCHVLRNGDNIYFPTDANNVLRCICHIFNILIYSYICVTLEYIHSNVWYRLWAFDILQPPLWLPTPSPLRYSTRPFKFGTHNWLIKMTILVVAQRGHLLMSLSLHFYDYLSKIRGENMRYCWILSHMNCFPLLWR